ncbi:MAG: DUF1566 domain-containing protein, partial [Gammaproteobacteria bacterium]|nr:DUF1566 domain-containing protein [Gammaproteobacteria bacterium]
PPQGNYTSGNPAQTSIALFKEGAAEAFQANWYWSSTEYNSSHGWLQGFHFGYQSTRYKSGALCVRAVRRVPI